MAYRVQSGFDTVGDWGEWLFDDVDMKIVPFMWVAAIPEPSGRVAASMMSFLKAVLAIPAMVATLVVAPILFTALAAVWIVGCPIAFVVGLLKN